MYPTYSDWIARFTKSRAGLLALDAFNAALSAHSDSEAVKAEVLSACFAISTHAQKTPAEAKEWRAAQRYAAALPKIAAHAKSLAALIRDNADRAYVHLYPVSVAFRNSASTASKDWTHHVPALLDEFVEQRGIKQFPQYCYARFAELGRSRNLPKPPALLALRLVFIFRAHSLHANYRSGRMPPREAGRSVGRPRRALVAQLVSAAFSVRYSVAKVVEAETLNPHPFTRFDFLPIPHGTETRGD